MQTMRVLLDACLPVQLRPHLTGVDCKTARYSGLADLDDGPLLAAMAGRFDVLITLDKSLPAQQALGNFPVAVIVLRCRSSKLADLLPLVPDILSTIKLIHIGDVIEIVG
jgi:predicted nuclease of predicted toxin-antitoxin system